MNRSAQDHRFSLFPVICSQLSVTRTPDNSNLFLFPLMVRVIGSPLYFIFNFNIYFYFVYIFTIFSILICLLYFNLSYLIIDLLFYFFLDPRHSTLTLDM